MKRKQRRIWIVVLCVSGWGSAVGLSLLAFRQNVVFFVTPSVLAGKAVLGKEFRLGGLVQSGTLKETFNKGAPIAQFNVTDGVKTIQVTYDGILPDLLREGQGVVALGRMDKAGEFQASEVLAKHDANYMPKEVEEALKKMGYWNPSTGQAPPPASTWSGLLAKEKGTL